MPIATNAGTGTGRAAGSGEARRKRRVVNGAPSNDLTLSAHIGSNETLFPKILKMYVADGQSVTFKLTKRTDAMRNIEEMPDWFRANLGKIETS